MRFLFLEKLRLGVYFFVILPIHLGSIDLSDIKPMVCCFSHVFERKLVIVPSMLVVLGDTVDMIGCVEASGSYIFCDRYFHNK